MTHDLFERPVTIFVGLGMPREVVTVFQAYAFLNECSLDRRKPSYLSARTACLDAMNRTGSAKAARDAFAVYARQAGILAAESEEFTLPRTDRAAEIRLAG